MKRTAALLALTALLPGLAGACGSDDDETAFCDQARELEGDSALGSAFAAAESPEEIEAFLDRAIAELEELADAAPEEISDEVDTVVEGYREVRDALAEVDYDVTAVGSELGERLGEGGEFQVAGDRVDEFLAEECGIDVRSDTGVDAESEG